MMSLYSASEIYQHINHIQVYASEGPGKLPGAFIADEGNDSSGHDDFTEFKE